MACDASGRRELNSFDSPPRSPLLHITIPLSPFLSLIVPRQAQHPMTVHVYHPYRQPDGTNHCQAVNGHCSHLCLPAPQFNPNSPKITCACPTGLKLTADGLMCEEGQYQAFCLRGSFTVLVLIAHSIGGRIEELQTQRLPFVNIFSLTIGS